MPGKRVGIGVFCALFVGALTALLSAQAAQPVPPWAAQVDRVFSAVRAWRQKDERVQVKEYDDLVQGDVTVHAFYVRYLLPIWFDVQAIEYEAAAAPKRAWHFA